MDETLEQQIARLTGQVADLTAANADLTGQLGTRTGELRAVRHKASFKAAALEAGVKPKAVDSLYRLSGYDPGEADEADPAAIAALIEASRDEHDYCFEPPAAAETPAPVVKAPAVAPVVKPVALGAARGKAPVADSKFRVTLAETRDPAWLAANKQKYQEAGKAGTLEITDLDP